MRYRSIIGSLAGASLMLAPIPAIAQSAPEPAVESVGSSQGLKDRRGENFMMYALVGGTVLAILLLLLLIKDERQEMPISP